MNETEALVTSHDGLPPAEWETPEAIAAMGGGGAGFLPYVKVCGGSTKEVKAGKFPVGHYALVVDGELLDLDKSFEAIPIAWRPKAMFTCGEELSISFKIESDLFKKIQEIANGPGLTDAFWGPEFLLFIPGHGFATFHYNSKSARNIVSKTLPCMRRPVMYTIKYIEQPKYQWHAPSVHAIPVLTGNASDMPDEAVMNNLVKDFMNPKEVIPGADKEEAPASDRAR